MNVTLRSRWCDLCCSLTFGYASPCRTVSDNGVVRSAKCRMAFMNAATPRGCCCSSQCTSRNRGLHTASPLVSNPPHIDRACPHKRLLLQDRLALSSPSSQSVRFLSTCVSLVPLALGVTCFRLVALACTCFRLAFRSCMHGQRAYAN